MWLLDLTNKQTILSQYDNKEIFNILGNILFQFWFFKRKKIWIDAIGIECNMKKVLCFAEKSSVIWAEPHIRSSAELNVRSVTTLDYSAAKWRIFNNSSQSHLY